MQKRVSEPDLGLTTYEVGWFQASIPSVSGRLTVGTQQLFIREPLGVVDQPAAVARFAEQERIVAAVGDRGVVHGGVGDTLVHHDPDDVEASEHPPDLVKVMVGGGFASSHAQSVGSCLIDESALGGVAHEWADLRSLF